MAHDCVGIGCSCGFGAGFDHVEDSGNHKEFTTGSKRSSREGKGRFDLIPAHALTRMAQHFENGAKVYGDRNWEKGQPLSRYLDSAMRHLVGYLGGGRSEDHIIACAWNCFAFVQTQKWIADGKLPQELDDMNEPDFIETVKAIHDNVLSQGWYAKERELARDAVEVQSKAGPIRMETDEMSPGEFRERLQRIQTPPLRWLFGKPRSQWQRFMARIWRKRKG